ncbi:MAG: imidazole glycerol phosphate synthase subunit HisF [Candidatus Kapaibacterium sp.]|jgi:cyclase
MVKKRIIPCLDICNGRTVKGVNFVELRDAGDPIELAQRYINDGADELVFLDISATIEKRKTLAELVEKIAKNINIPFTVGGGIHSLEDARTVIKSGADKISINSSAVQNPSLISAIANEFGSQCVVVAIDTKFVNTTWMVFINGGKKTTEFTTLSWAKHAEMMGAGEILLTSMNNDGTKNGFALDILTEVSVAVNIPVIASGGAGEKLHFRQLFEQTRVSAALAASIFHYNDISIPQIKQYLQLYNISVRL